MHNFAYVEELAEDCGVELRVARAARQVIEQAIAKGHGGKDMAAIREGAGE